MDGLKMKAGTEVQNTVVTVFGSVNSTALDTALAILNDRIGVNVTEGATDIGAVAKGGVVLVAADKAEELDLASVTGRAHVLVLADDVEAINIPALANAGVAGVISAASGPERIALVLELVARGGQAWPTAAVATSIASLPGHAEKVVGVDRISSLTRRQRDVLNLVAKGKSNQAIGDQLGLNLSTVKGHVRGIFTTLGVRNRTQAVLALQHAVSQGVA